MISREHYIEKVRPFYESDLIKIITGIRRSGKSKLMDSYIEYLEKNDSRANVIFIDFFDFTAVFIKNIFFM